jgi:N-acetylglucosaminyl-diphospho-decaprenol L-rhamnosyltransferase
VLGAALALRRTAFEAIGGFDEGYHLYFEEVDLCYRMRQAGWEVHFAPVTEVIHAGGASTNQCGAAMLREVVLSSRRFYERHYAGTRLTAARIVLHIGMLGRWLRDELRARVASAPARRRELKTQAGVWRRALTVSSRRSERK